MTHDEPAKILFHLPMDSQVTIMAALLSDEVISEHLGRAQWFLRWVKQNPNLLTIAVAAAQSIRKNGWEK